MKKNDFDNRLQNDLFPQMPASFARKLQQTLESEGVQGKKRSSATGIFTGVVSVAAAAAVLLIVLVGVLSGGRSDRNQAAAPGGATTTPAATEAPMTWPWKTRVITLSAGFEFQNEEKFQALYTNILYSLMRRGESEPDELWLCAIKSRYVAADTGDRADGYLSGYYVLAQHAFGVNDGPELYCLSDDFEVLWCTEGSAPGPNHAVNPEGDNYAGTYQGHFLYGMAPTTASVTRGALVGNNPKEKTDVEFSMTAWFPRITERLAGSAHLDAAREYFLLTVSARDWDSVMENPVLRFETEEGKVDVNMQTELPLVNTLSYAQLHSDGASPTALPGVYGVEYWLSQNQPLITDLTAEWDDKEAVEIYAQAVARALRTSGEQISSQGIWICAVTHDWEDAGEGSPTNAYILAWNVSDGDFGPELFYYENGRISWRTQGADTGRINVVYHKGNTLVFGRSPAYDGQPLPMSYGKIVLENGSDQVTPVLTLDEIQQRVLGGPHYAAARECYLWMDGAVHEVSRVTITVQTADAIREYTLDKVNVLTPQDVPAMALESDGVIYPGVVTHEAQSLNADGVAGDGTPLVDTLRSTAFEEIRIVRMRDRALPWQIFTASDQVTVDRVEVYSGSFEGLCSNAEISVVDELPPGSYYLCFHTTTLGPYSEKIGRYTYTTDYTIYKAKLN